MEGCCGHSNETSDSIDEEIMSSQEVFFCVQGVRYVAENTLT